MSSPHFDRAILAKDCAELYGWHEATALKRVNEFLDRFIVLKREAADATAQRLAPSKQLDNVWRAAMHYTQEYAQHCQEVAGFFVHYRPQAEHEYEANKQRYRDTLKLYELVFGSELAGESWHRNEEAHTDPLGFSAWLRTRADFRTAQKQLKRKRKTPHEFRNPNKDYDDEDSVVEEEPEPPGLPIGIFVKTLTGSTLDFKVSRLASVLWLKRLIHHKDKTPIVQQRLIFAGRQMEDKHTLADYGIQAESMIHLVLRLRGC